MLCQQVLIRSRVPSWGHGSPKGITLEMSHPIKEEGKLGPRYIGPFMILAWVGRDVSQLWKCLVDDSTLVPLRDIQVDEHLNYIERLFLILDWNKKTLKNKDVELVKVRWQNRKGL